MSDLTPADLEDQVHPATSEEPDIEEPIIEESRPPLSRQKQLVIGAAAIGFVLILYLLLLNNIVGMHVDDAWYVLLAKSLATGNGFSMINSPTPGILPLYPPGYPFILSLLYRLYPHFPENLWLLKSLSIFSMIGAGVLSWYYFSQLRQFPKHFSFMVALGVSVCVPLVFLATSSTMSECFFTFILIASITLIEKSVQKNGHWKYLVAGSAVASLAFLTRSVAVGLLIAIGLYLLKERLYRAVVIFSLVTLIICGPWMIYSRTHAPTPEQTDEQSGYIVIPYNIQFWEKVAGNPDSGTITASELPGRVWTNIFSLAARDLGRIMIMPVVDALNRQDLLNRANSNDLSDMNKVDINATAIISSILSLFTLIGFLFVVRAGIKLSEIAVVLMLAITFLWPFEALRFVLPLIPFLLVYFANGCRSLLILHQRLSENVNVRAQWLVMSIVVAIVVAINILGNSRKLITSSDSIVKDALSIDSSFDEYQQMISWIRENTPPEAVIATQNPPLLNLYSGHKTIAFDDLEKRWELWKKLNVRYWAGSASIPSGTLQIGKQHFRVAHRVTGNLDLLVVDLGDPSTRESISE